MAFLSPSASVRAPHFGTITPIKHGLELSEPEASPDNLDKYVKERRSVYNIKVDNGLGVIHHWHQWGSKVWPQDELIESDTFDLSNPDNAAVEKRRFQNHAVDMLDNLNVPDKERVRTIAWVIQALSQFGPLHPPKLITQSQQERDL